jgi:tripartite-type tricarboxylate transporter receptor subunit TctC
LIAVIPYLLLVTPGSGIAGVKDLIAAAKAKPGALNYGSAGTASTSHLAGALFARLAGIDITHVPYKGSAPAAIDLIGGRLQLIFEATAAAMPHVKSGRLRALGVSTPTRIASLPELSTIAEAGVPGYEISTWHGICAPARTPAAVVDRLNREIVSTMNAQDPRERLAGLGAEFIGSTPKEFGALIQAEVPRLDKLMRDIGVK